MHTQFFDSKAAVGTHSGDGDGDNPLLLLPYHTRILGSYHRDTTLIPPSPSIRLASTRSDSSSVRLLLALRSHEIAEPHNIMSARFQPRVVVRAIGHGVQVH